MTSAGSQVIRAGFCAIVGLPNVGKSTLLNRILGTRLVAVSPKPQTTRNRILGIHLQPVEGGAAQIAFVDTPGAQAGKGPLRKFMRDEATAAASSCDLVLVVVDASDRNGRSPTVLDSEELADIRQALAAHPGVIALNKVDMVAKPNLLPLMERWAKWKEGLDVVPISATTGDGIDQLTSVIARLLPAGPALFPPDMVSDRSDRFLAAELIREQLYHQLGKELPYACAVQIETWNERPSRKEVSVGAVIVVERDSQKPIVVGRGGQRIKQLGIAAREALAEMLEMKVHLTLFVKVIPEWSRGQRDLQELVSGPSEKS